MVTVKPVNQVRTVCAIWLFLIFFQSLTAHGEPAILSKAVDAAPVLSKIESADLPYISGSGGVKITNTLTVSDADSKSIRSATIQITGGFSSSEDFLRFTVQHRIIGSWNKFTGVLTLSGSASLTNYESALRSIQYENTNIINPSTVKRTVSFRINDGLSNSNTVTRNIIVSLANRAPVLSRLESSPLVYCMNSGSVQVTSTIEVSDPDNKNLASAKIQINAGYTGNEKLNFTDQNGISGSWDNTGGVLNLSGDAAVSAYQEALRSITYTTNGTEPVAGSHSIAFSITDGTTTSNTVTRSIVVNGRVTAVLSGDAAICNDNNTKATLSIALTGTPPWNLIVMRDNGNDLTYNNITKNPYTFETQQEGIYRIKSVSDANCTGDTSGSGYARVAYAPSPTAAISGTDTICQGDTSEIQISLTGSAPWNIRYNLNGTEQSPINNILKAPYILKVTNAGNYTLKAISDVNCQGIVSGTAIVSQYPVPRASISGTETICDHTAGNLHFDLTGNPPWKFRYKLDNGSPVGVENVLLNPKVIPAYRGGTYTLVDMNDRHCRGLVSGSATITIRPTPVVTISGLAPAYAKEDNQLVLITGTPSGGTFSGPGLFYSDPSWYFLPGYAPVGTVYIVYSYQATPGSCFGYDTVAVRVLEAEAAIDFPDDRTNFCQNEPSFTVSGVNLVNAMGTFSISEGAGLIDNHDNTATIIPSDLDVKEYTITYTYFDAMPLSVTSKFNIRNSPEANFRWESECYTPGQSVKFDNTSTSTFGNITGSSWKIHTDAGYDTASTHDMVYSFPKPENYLIELQVQSSYGCIGTVAKTFGLKPLIPLSDTSYFENFNSPASWQSGTLTLPAINSWKLDDPSNDFPGASPGDYCWFTHIPATSAPLENSWVASPCFDFRGTERPMLKMNIWRQFDSNRDGVNLQVTSDSGKTWTLLGQIGDGIQWFNHYDISGNPGNSIVGWSSNSSGAGNDTHWVEARHSLDVIKNKPQVQFKFSYGSDGSAQDNKGFAFDNFWIGERNRTTLLEHFTNASDNLTPDADQAINKLVNNDSLNIVDLQYHTSFPGEDPFNEQESYIPGARVLYYGISDVPYSVLNGGAIISHLFDYNLRQLDTNTVHIESLTESKFRINLRVQVDPNTIHAETEIIANREMSATELTVHVAVVERKITGLTGNNGETVFENVVKTLLPDAAGTTLYRPWGINDNAIIDDTWDLVNVYDRSELRVVAFIQDEATREVYQVAEDSPSFVTGTNDIPGHGNGNKFLVYPNPASDHVSVRFESPVSRDVRIEIYDNLGSLIRTGRIEKGEEETQIPAGGLPDGLYIIRTISGDRETGARKLTIAQ